MIDQVIQTPRMKATFVKDVSDRYSGTAHLFKLSRKDKVVTLKDDPTEDYGSYRGRTGLHELFFDHIVISAINLQDLLADMMPKALLKDRTYLETFIFPANEKGEVICWQNLPGSYRGDIDIDRARKNYESANNP